MKPKPLTKEKILHARILGEVGIAKVTKIEDVKSAVQWLLKEIEKDNKNMKIEKEVGHKERRAYFRGWYDAEKWCIDLVKKAFFGVVEE